MTRVVLQERRQLLREGLMVILRGVPEIQVVAAVATLEEALDAVESHGVDVLLIEHVSVRAEGAATALRRLRDEVGFRGRVVAYGDRVHGELLAEAHGMGVDLVVDRNRGGSGLVHAVCDRQVRALPRVPLRPVRPGEPRLSDRELEVIRLLAGGWTTLDVARAMSISPKTVENHKQRIFVKLDARNAAHAVARAVRLGLVSEPHEYAAVGS